MGLIKLFGKILEIIKKWFDTIVAKFWGKAHSDVSGKIKGISPDKLTSILKVIGVIIIIILIAISFTKPDDKITGGLKNFETESTPSSGVESRFDSRSLDGDIDKALNSGLNTPVEMGTAPNTGGSVFDSVVAGSSSSLSECLELIDKMKTGVKLTDTEAVKSKQCLEENPMGLTDAEKKFAEKMLDPNLTDAERKFLGDALAGKLTPDQLAVAEALASGDPEKARLASEAINSGNPDLITALGRQLNNEPLTPEQQALLDTLGKSSGTAKDGVSTSTVGTASPTVNIPKDLEDTALSIQERDKKIEDLQKEQNLARTEAKDLSDKLGEGTDLSKNEIDRLQQIAENKKTLETLKKVQAEEKARLAEQMRKIKEALGRTSATVGQISPTGVFIEYEGEDVDCKPKPFVKKKAKTPKVSFVDFDNRPLRPEEVEFIKLLRKKGGKSEDKDLTSAFIGNLGEPLSVARNGEAQLVDVNQLKFFTDQGLKGFELSADLRVPAILESEILVSDKQGPAIVRLKIIQDVYDNNNVLVIPKNSVAIASTGSFDADTGIMNISIEKVVVGGKTITTRFTLGSADGSSGLKGQVRDTTGKYLLGAFIPAFAGSALSYFSQSQVQPYLQSTSANQVLTGSALAGSAEVMNRIAELAASKMLNAAKIYWVPRGIPVVLYPQ